VEFLKAESDSDGSQTSLDSAAAECDPLVAIGLPPGVSKALSDPIVMALMAADRVDPKRLENLLRQIAGRLARRDPQNSFARLVGCEKPAAGTGLAKFAKGVVLALAVIAGVLGTPRPAAADEAPVAFIRTLGTQAVSVIRSAAPLGAKAAYFDQMVRQDFDLTDICRFVLGPYWRVANPAERQQFCDGFADRLVRFYGRQLAQSGDGEFVVTGSRTDPGGVIVASRIIRPQGPSIALDWRLGISDGFYKIEDVAIDGVSMALAQRSEISGMIAREGGQVETLLATMHNED
jgi:phospholipid transport system substrate-binding protein